MAIDDMSRLESECPVFPLRDDHLNVPLVQNGVVTSKMRYYRDGYNSQDGRLEEQAYCDVHQRREFSHVPTLTRTRPNITQVAQRREIGKKVVRWASFAPILGWPILYGITTRAAYTNDLVWNMSAGKVHDFAEEEVKLAEKTMYWSMGGTFFVLLLLLAILLAVELT